MILQPLYESEPWTLILTLVGKVDFGDVHSAWQNLKIQIPTEFKNECFISLVLAKYNLTLTSFLFFKIQEAVIRYKSCCHHIICKVFYQCRLDNLGIGEEHLYFCCNILLARKIQGTNRGDQMRKTENKLEIRLHQFHSSLLWQPFWKLKLMMDRLSRIVIN